MLDLERLSDSRVELKCCQKFSSFLYFLKLLSFFIYHALVSSKQGWRTSSGTRNSLRNYALRHSFMQDPRRGPGQNKIYWSHKQSTTFLQWSTYYSLDVHLSSDNTAMPPNRVALHYVNIIINSSDLDVRVSYYFSTTYHHCLTPRIPSQWLKTLSLVYSSKYINTCPTAEGTFNIRLEMYV
jgi:hypothetical protein